jgi:hypothetical protein
MSSALPVAGFAVIEAATMHEAVRLASQTPCAVAQGVVSVIVTRRFDLTEPGDHALGRSRGGWTTKLHLTCDQGRNVLSVAQPPRDSWLRRLERHLWNTA